MPLARQISHRLVALAWLAGCATPDAHLPRIGEDDIARERTEVQRQALDKALAREARVRRLAWPILTSNTELCRKTAPRIGWRIGDAATVTQLASGLRESDVRALGWGEAPRVLSVAPGSPADAAGIAAGDRIIAVAGDPLTEDDLRATVKSLTAALAEREPEESLEVTISRDGSSATFTVIPEPACDVRIVSSARGAVNASASFTTLTINAGLVRALADDNQLAFVIAHELAHVAGRHPRKVIRNMAATGTALWAPPALLAAGLVDWLTAYPAKRLGSKAPPLSTAVTRAAAGAVRSTSFEAEADYVGLYMHVRAGGEVDGLAGVFQVFADRSPRSSWLRVTHPTVPERKLRLARTAEEIAAKQAAGLPLIPEGWEAGDGD